MYDTCPVPPAMADEVAAFDDFAATPQEEPSPSSFFEQGDLSGYGAAAAGGWGEAAEPSAAPQAATSGQALAAQQWTEASLPWQEAEPAAATAPWEPQEPAELGQQPEASEAAPWEQATPDADAAEGPWERQAAPWEEAKPAVGAWEQAAAPRDQGGQQAAPAEQQQPATAPWTHQAAGGSGAQPPAPAGPASLGQQAVPWVEADRQQAASNASAPLPQRRDQGAAPGGLAWQPAAPADADSFFNELAAASSPAAVGETGLPADNSPADAGVAATAWVQPSSAPFQTSDSVNAWDPAASEVDPAATGQLPGPLAPFGSTALKPLAAQPAATLPQHAPGAALQQDGLPGQQAPAATAAPGLPAGLRQDPGGASAQPRQPPSSDALDLDSPEAAASAAGGLYPFMQQQEVGAAEDFDFALQVGGWTGGGVGGGVGEGESPAQRRPQLAAR